MKKIKGLHAYRYKDNPEEKAFAAAWAKENAPTGTSLAGPTTLAHLLGDGAGPADISDRDHTVAATVVQWFGSPVGQGFLRDLGYIKVLVADVALNIQHIKDAFERLALHAAQRNIDRCDCTDCTREQRYLARQVPALLVAAGLHGAAKVAGCKPGKPCKEMQRALDDTNTFATARRGAGLKTFFTLKGGSGVAYRTGGGAKASLILLNSCPWCGGTVTKEPPKRRTPKKEKS